MIAARHASTFTVAVGLGSSQRAVLRCMADGCARSVAEAATHAGLTLGQTRNAMSTLHRHGFTKPAPPRKWVITTEGRTTIDILRAHDFLEIHRQRRKPDPTAAPDPGSALPVDLADAEQGRPVDAHVLLLHDNQVMLTRHATGWRLPAGALTAGESATGAAARKAFDTVGVIVEPGDLSCVHTLHMHRIGPEPRLGLFFVSRRWIGEPFNRQPETCTDVRWFEITRLPETLDEYPAAGISAYRNGIPFSERGWTEPAEPLSA
jgi:ADP-ribose pyrophosphatase YjhB (NUDIX family)